MSMIFLDSGRAENRGNGHISAVAERIRVRTERTRCDDMPPSRGGSGPKPYNPANCEVAEPRPAERPTHFELGRWCDSLTTDYWSPPTAAAQEVRQKILVVILSFVLASLLADGTWGIILVGLILAATYAYGYISEERVLARSRHRGDRLKAFGERCPRHD